MINKWYYYFMLAILGILVFACKEDNIVILTQGEPIFPFSSAQLELKAEVVTGGRISINRAGVITCDRVTISFEGFEKAYKFYGYANSSSSIIIYITPLDTAANSRLRFEASHSGTNTTGKLYYCDNVNNNCNYSEIGHIIGIYSNHYEGFYYSPLFYGEYDIFAN